MRLWASSSATAAQSCVRSFSSTSTSRSTSLWHQSAQAAHHQQQSKMKSFPTEDLLPKKETQANLLHAKGLLGQNTRVAVLDTGVDPAAAGLTSRVVDVIDCTGDGDIPLKSVEPTKSSDNAIQLQSQTGRLLRVNKDWNNPTGQWKVGYKRAYELWPKDLVARRKAERKEDFTRSLSQLLNAAVADMNKFESESESSSSKKPDEKASEEDKEQHKAKKQDLKDRVAALETASGSFVDPGPFIEVAAWHDGEHWRSVCAAAEGEPGQELGIPIKLPNGQPEVVDLSSLRPMTDFRTERHFAHFGSQDLLTYSVNFYDDGNVLSLVCVSGAHGTHVAGIIAANHPDQPDLNGIAPEAEIVSLKIGDNRVDSLETHKALLRASKAILDTKCDMANMSFGEDSAWGMETRGIFVRQLIDEVCRKRDVLFATSAGNSGPALTTVGAPAAGGGPLFSIGAWVSEKMQQAEYALVDGVPSSVYTWCSRGPLFDGAAGVTCYAPGAAITSVPRYTLNHTQLMNGTSMASPSFCGGLALLVSGMKQQKIRVTPARVTKAIQSTWKDIQEDVGLLQVQGALQHLEEHKDVDDEDAEWVVSVSPRGAEAGRGVYLRTAEECAQTQEFVVDVHPEIKRADTEKRYELDLEATLSSDCNWVEAPAFAALNGKGRMFKIRVNPQKLEPGLHRTNIHAKAADGRFLFSVPVTIAKPVSLPASNSEAPELVLKSTYKPGTINRYFVDVPQGATWADIKVSTSKRDTATQFWLHCVQLQGLCRLSQTEEAFIWSLMPGEAVTHKRIKVQGGQPMEICATQAWNASGKTDIEITADFHGLSLTSGPETFSALGGQVNTPFNVYSALRTETLSPSVSFDTRRSVLRPSAANIVSLPSQRDQLPSGKNLFGLELTYDIKMGSKATVTPSFPIMNHLYDGPFAVLSCIYGKTKEIIKWGDMYSRDVELAKGNYVLKIELLHPSKQTLEGLKTMVMTLDTKLDGKAKDAKLSIYRDHVDLLTGGSPLKTEGSKIAKGSARAYRVKTSLPSDALADVLKEGAAGDVLLGQYHLTPPAWKLGRTAQMTIPPAEPSFPDSSEDPPKEPKTMLSLQLEMGKKIEDQKEKVSFFEKLAGENPKDLDTLVARLEVLDDSASDEQVFKAANAIFSSVDEDKLAMHFGTKRPEFKTVEDHKSEKQASKQKAALGTAFERKTARVLKQSSAPSEKSDDSYDRASVPDEQQQPYSDATALLKGWRRWSEDGNKLSLAKARQDIARGLFGTGLVAIQKILQDIGNSEDAMAKEARELERKAIKALEWPTLLEVEDKKELIKSPPAGFALW